MTNKEWKKKIDEIIIKRKKYRDPDYSAQMLAGELEVSIFQLARILKKVYGLAYSDIVLPRRVKDAKKHLTNPRKQAYTVEEIGILVGFCNKWSFYQAFKKYTGITPNEWRKSQLDNNE